MNAIKPRDERSLYASCGREARPHTAHHSLDENSSFAWVEIIPLALSGFTVSPARYECRSCKIINRMTLCWRRCGRSRQHAHRLEKRVRRRRRPRRAKMALLKSGAVSEFQ